MVAEGDASLIENLLKTHLVKLAVDPSGWRTLYRHSETGKLWELDYPQSEMHGGGPRRLRELGAINSANWA
jgi:hypothetical protein